MASRRSPVVANPNARWALAIWPRWPRGDRLLEVLEPLRKGAPHVRHLRRSASDACPEQSQPCASLWPRLLGRCVRVHSADGVHNRADAVVVVVCPSRRLLFTDDHVRVRRLCRRRRDQFGPRRSPLRRVRSPPAAGSGDRAERGRGTGVRGVARAARSARRPGAERPRHRCRDRDGNGVAGGTRGQALPAGRQSPSADHQHRRQPRRTGSRRTDRWCPRPVGRPRPHDSVPCASRRLADRARCDRPRSRDAHDRFAAPALPSPARVRSGAVTEPILRRGDRRGDHLRGLRPDHVARAELPRRNAARALACARWRCLVRAVRHRRAGADADRIARPAAASRRRDPRAARRHRPD